MNFTSFGEDFFKDPLVFMEKFLTDSALLDFLLQLDQIGSQGPLFTNEQKTVSNYPKINNKLPSIHNKNNNLNVFGQTLSGVFLAEHEFGHELGVSLQSLGVRLIDHNRCR